MKKIFHSLGLILMMVLILGTGGGCTKSARAKRLLKAANRDFNEEKYDSAELEYKSVLRLGQVNPTAIGQLGRIYAKEGRLLDARMYLTEAAKRSPNSLPVQLALGQVDAAIRDTTNAAKIALRILSAQPTNEEALLLLTDNFSPMQELQRQLASLPHITENPGYHEALAMMALRQRKYAEAESELRLAVAANPKSSPAYFALAELHAIQNDGKEAAQDLKMAAEFAPLRSSVRIRYADFLIQSGAAEEARKIFQDMTDKAPDYIPGWIGLMNMSMKEKNYDDVAKICDTILSRDDRNYEGLLGRAGASLAKGDAAMAKAQFEHMDSIYKRSPQVKYELAAAYIMTHEKDKAIASLNQALALNPGYAQAALLLGQLYIRGGNPAEAVVMLTQFIKKTTGIGQVYLLLADAYMALQKPDDALAVYRNLTKALPKNPQIPLMMGIVLAGQRKDEAARDAFENSLALSPDYMPALEQLINLDVAEHKYKEATALVQAQINKTPKSSALWELQAKIDLAQADMARAEKDLLKAVDLNPVSPAPYLLLAQVYVSSKNYPEALKKLNALVAQTNDAAAYLQIGAIHEQLKEYDAARDAYEKVLSINSNSIPALNNLSYIYSVRMNKIDRAYELAQRARDLMPYDPNVGDTLAWIFFKKGDYPRALTLLTDSAERTPADPEIQFHLGMTHYMLGEEDAARIALQRAVASKEDFPNKDDARSRLAVLNMDPNTAGISALPDLEKALQEHPDDPVILNRIGILQERGGEMEKAAETYEAALKKNPEATPIMAKLARLYALRLNQPDKALKWATTAHKLAPDNADASAILGHLIYHSGGDYPRALGLLESALDRLPNHPDLLYDLAWSYYSVGRIADAETTMQKALQNGASFAGSEDAKRFMALADAFSSASKAQAAAAQAQQVLQTDANYVPALMVSGATDERAGNFKPAQSVYEKVLKDFPQFVPAARQLAILDGKYFTDDAQGYVWAEKARSAYPDDLEVAKSLGILSFYQAKYPKSAELLRESVAKSQADGELYYYLGMDYYQLKKKKETKQALQQALALKISDKPAAEAKRILAELK